MSKDRLVNGPNILYIATARHRKVDLKNYCLATSVAIDLAKTASSLKILKLDGKE